MYPRIVSESLASPPLHEGLRKKGSKLCVLFCFVFRLCLSSNTREVKEKGVRTLYPRIVSESIVSPQVSWWFEPSQAQRITSGLILPGHDGFKRKGSEFCVHFLLLTLWLPRKCTRGYSETRKELVSCNYSRQCRNLKGSDAFATVHQVKEK